MQLTLKCDWLIVKLSLVNYIYLQLSLFLIYNTFEKVLQQEIWLLQYEYLQIIFVGNSYLQRDVDYNTFWNSLEIICGLGLQVSQLRNQFYFMVRGVDAPREDTWKSSAKQDE